MNTRGRIIVEKYNPDWEVEFQKLRSVFISYINAKEIEIEHVGSTSVVGLTAKPILDIDIIIEDDSIKGEVILDLSKLGYLHVGNLGITGREAFKRQNLKAPINGSKKEWQIHNLYLCTRGSIGLQNHINFRNYLRQHPQKVKEYGKLKRDLATEYPFDIDAYIDGKTDFIIDILSKTGIKKSDTNKIADENRIVK